MSPLFWRQPLLRFGPAVMATALVTALSLLPAYFFRGVESSLPPINNLDKIIHALLYAGLTAAYLHAVPLSQRARLGVALRVALSATLYGVLMELCQNWLTTTRTMDVFDALANASGAFACALPACAWSRRRTGRSDRANHAGH